MAEAGPFEISTVQAEQKYVYSFPSNECHANLLTFKNKSIKSVLFFFFRCGHGITLYLEQVRVFTFFYELDGVFFFSSLPRNCMVYFTSLRMVGFVIELKAGNIICFFYGSESMIQYSTLIFTMAFIRTCEK